MADPSLGWCDRPAVVSLSPAELAWSPLLGGGEQSWSSTASADSSDQLQLPDPAIQQLLALCSPVANVAGMRLTADEDADASQSSTASEEILSNQDLTLDKAVIARDLLGEYEPASPRRPAELAPLPMTSSPRYPAELTPLPVTSSPLPHAAGELDWPWTTECASLLTLMTASGCAEDADGATWRKPVPIGAAHQAVLPPSPGRRRSRPTPPRAPAGRLLWSPARLSEAEVEHYLRRHLPALAAAGGLSAPPAGVTGASETAPALLREDGVLSCSGLLSFSAACCVLSAENSRLSTCPHSPRPARRDQTCPAPANSPGSVYRDQACPSSPSHSPGLAYPDQTCPAPSNSPGPAYRDQTSLAPANSPGTAYRDQMYPSPSVRHDRHAAAAEVSHAAGDGPPTAPARHTTLPDNEQALHQLQQCDHRVEEALRRLRPTGGARVASAACARRLSCWSEREADEFEDGLRLHGKNFHVIQREKVRTRSVREIVHFYYLWKKTERHRRFLRSSQLDKRRLCTQTGGAAAAHPTPGHIQCSAGGEAQASSVQIVMATEPWSASAAAVAAGCDAAGAPRVPHSMLAANCPQLLLP